MDTPRILYVDDDDGLRRLIERALARRGFAVETAADADEGLARLRSERFDLVAVDHHMPRKSGREMLDEIVEMEDHPPVVFVTGNDNTGVAVEAIHAGASDFVVKTVGESFFDLLDGRFRQALTRSRLERDKRQVEDDLRAANERLELLVREVHHRVSNSLQMVSSFVGMQASQTSDQQSREILAATQNRIKAVSKVHQNLYTRGDIGTLDLDEYLRALIDELGESLSEGETQVTLELHAENVEVSPDDAVSIGVVLNELVTNAAKYAFDGRDRGTISVELVKEGDDGYCLTVADDGKGIDEAAGPQGSGLGMRIITAVSRGLDSKVDLVPSEIGTRYRLRVKSRAPSPGS